MKKFACAALGMAGFLVLSACGSSDSAKNKAERDDVEMPAEESVSAVPDGSGPMADPSANATDSAADSSAASSADTSANAVDSAAAAAEKKM